MSKDIPTLNRIDKESLFMLEYEEPFFAFGRDKLWFSIEDKTPDLTLSADELIHILVMTGEWELEEDSSFYQILKGAQVSQLILTFGRHDREPFGVHYEIGFYDGEGFNRLDGYRIYPPPKYWMPLPKPPIK